MKTWTEFSEELQQAGHLIYGEVPGISALGVDIERVISGLSAALRKRVPASDQVTRLSFPPICAQNVTEGTDYVSSFPQLIGQVQVFLGDDKAHRRLLAERDEGMDWTSHLAGSNLTMVSAACHPLYGVLRGSNIEDVQRYDIVGHCFRHEPSVDPSRRISFRMHEQVLVGGPDDAVAHRDVWLDRCEQMLGDLGLEVSVEVAHDPFFGKAGRMLASGQTEQHLKFEILAPTSGDGLTAIASGNYHREHFGENFAIRHGGEVAHSACFGLGLERTALALLARHGCDVDGWPEEVRAQLGLD